LKPLKINKVKQTKKKTNNYKIKEANNKMDTQPNNLEEPISMQTHIEIRIGATEIVKSIEIIEIIRIIGIIGTIKTKNEDTLIEIKTTMANIKDNTKRVVAESTRKRRMKMRSKDRKRSK
jgi:hypothetical protein